MCVPPPGFASPPAPASVASSQCAMSSASSAIAAAHAAPEVEETVEPTLRETLEAEHRTASEDMQKLTLLLNAAKTKRDWAQLRLNALTRKEMKERLGPLAASLGVQEESQDAPDSDLDPEAQLAEENHPAKKQACKKSAYSKK